MFLDKSGLEALWNKIKTMFANIKTDLASTKTDLANIKANSVSLQRQIVPSAAVESSATASQAYAAGDYVVVNGILRKVKRAIAKGNTISDSNSTATTVTNSIKSAEYNASKSVSTLNNVSKMFVGTVVSTIKNSSAADGHEALLFSAEDFVYRFGRSFDPLKDYVGVMNADGEAENAYLGSATYFRSENIWVGVPGVTDGNPIRINYLVILG